MKERILSFLQKEIDGQVTPGTAILIKWQGKTILKEAIGTNSLEDDRVPLTTRHLFDVASLTKVMATLPAVLQLLESGEIYLQDKVARFLPEFGRNGKGDVSLRQLLTHSSGLAAHRHYYEKRLSYEEVLNSICEEQLVYQPDTEVIYSDLGYMLLGEVISRITAQPFQRYVRDNVYKPMGMDSTGFLPKGERQHFAPTEYLEHLGGHKYGIVHDDNTEFMGGISGHAGLFSSLEDIEKYCDMLESDGYCKGRKILHPHWLRKSRENFTPFSKEARGIGWQMKGTGPSPIGDLLSSRTYGHTGFTGTSFYLDPENELYIVLLTNRVYFGRHDAMIRLRPRLHNLVMSNL